METVTVNLKPSKRDEVFLSPICRLGGVRLDDPVCAILEVSYQYY